MISLQQKYDEDQKIVLDEYLMESMLCMLVPHAHSLTDQVCKPVSNANIGDEYNWILLVFYALRVQQRVL